MNLKTEFNIILVVAVIAFTALTSHAQTFDCYITNDRLTSPTEYEFDVYVKATSTDFRIRTIQFAFSFNLGFVPLGSTISSMYVPGSTQMVNYIPGAIQQSTPDTTVTYAFQVGPNTGFTCANGTTVISGQRIRIGSWRITSSLPFNCIPANPSIIRPSDPQFGIPVLLKFQISRWNTLDCSSGTLNTIFGNNGTFTSFVANTLLDSLTNMRPSISSNPVADTVCSDAGVAAFSVSAIGNGTDIVTNPLSYQWYEGNNLLTNTGVYSDVTTSSLLITNPSFSMNGKLFYCKVFQGNPAAVVRNSSSAVLKVIESNDNNACTIDNCDVLTGIVTNTPVSEINDNNLCTDDSCDPLTGVVSHTPNWSQDLNLCNIESCDPATGTLSSTPVDTNDYNGCTIDACDPASGTISHTDNTFNDNNVCTNDVCDPATGVTTHSNILSLSTSSTPESCSGNDGTATVNHSGGVSPYSYLWIPGGQTSQTAIGLQEGNYSITVTDGSNCTHSSSVNVATTVPVQSPGPISGPELVCSNQNPVVYCIDSVPGYSTYVWTLPPGASIAGASDGKCITVSFNNNYNGGNICVHIANGCSGNNSCISVSTINDKPKMKQYISGDTKLCPLTSGSFSINPVPKATGYLWVATGGLVLTSGQGTTTVQVSSLAGFVRGTLSVQAINCMGISSKSKLTIRGLPVSPLWDYDDKDDNATTVCGGSMYKYEIHFNPDITCYVWAAPPGATIFDQSGNSGNPLTISNGHNDDVRILFPQGFIAGTVSVSSCNSCGTSNAATLNVRSTPTTPGLITGAQNVCKNSTGSYSIFKIPDAKYYSWTITGGATIYSGQGTNKIKVKFNSANTTIVDLSVKAKNKCGFSDASLKSIAVNLNCKTTNFGIDFSNGEIKESNNLSIALFPNPATTQIKINLIYPENGNCTLKLVDIAGKVVLEKPLNFTEGNNTFSYDVSSLENGFYFAWIIWNDKKWMEKIIISR